MSKPFIENGIDISHWNVVEDFNKVKASGVDFAIIKAGGSDKGFYTDRCFDNYYRLARLADIKVGAYYFVGPNFLSYEDGVADAKRFLAITYGKEFDYPLCLDIETTDPKKKEQATEGCIGFCEYLEENGKYVSIYASDISGFKDRLILDDLTKFDKWVARYGKKPVYVEKYGIWQKSSTGQIDGIRGNVDLDTSYVDYKKIMVKKNLNRR
jgi:GH25 family lysozyme M1 (1,4-beta-N-acetylmuramidase)